MNNTKLSNPKRDPPKNPLVYIIIIITKYFSGEGRGVTLMYQGFQPFFIIRYRGKAWAMVLLNNNVK